jgi:Aerotolerance regulator N-terminal/von Willebrand factor type A domain
VRFFQGVLPVINFLNPLFLLGLAAASIPFIIHFLNRFRAGRREFSSLMLLKEIQHRQMRNLKMRQWLLLVLRTLIIALLVLVPSRPVVKGFFRSGPKDHLPTAAVFILDISASMGYVGREGSAYELLRERLNQITEWLNSGDIFKVITADESFTLPEGQWRRKSVRDDFLSELVNYKQPGSKGTSLGPALKAAADLLMAETSVVGREVYLLTDRQRGFLGTDTLELEPGSDIRWYLLESHESDPENLSVVSISFSGELLRPGVPLKARVEVAHFGGEESIRCLPRVYLDGRLVAQGEAVVPPNEASQVVVEMPAMEAGFHELTAMLDADGLEADNSCTSVINVPSRASVLLVQGNVEKSDYLGAALEVMAEGTSGPLSVSRTGNLPLSAAEFDRADLIIIHGLDYPASTVQAFWERAVSYGANVLVFPSNGKGNEAGNLKKFNSAFDRLGLPLSLGPVVSSGQGWYDTPERRGGGAASAGSIFSPLFETIVGLEKIKVFARRSLPSAGNLPAAGVTGGAAPPEFWDLPLAGGGTLLRLVRTPRLKVALATANLADPGECELPETPLFVPFLHALTGMINTDSPMLESTFYVGEKVNIYFGIQQSTERMEIHGPNESRFRLAPEVVSRVVFDRTDFPGTYRLYDGEKNLAAFSIGIKPEESDLRLEEREKLERFYKDSELQIIGLGEKLDQIVFSARGGVEAWPMLIILAIILLIAEQVVANPGKKED